MKITTTITDKNIDSAGIPLDYKNAITELIWNSFDVSMTSFDIQKQAKTKKSKITNTSKTAQPSKISVNKLFTFRQQ